MKRLVCHTDKVKLSRFLADSIEGLKPSYIRMLIKNKDIKINGRRVSSDETLNKGDNLEVYLDEKKLYPPRYQVLGDYKDIAVFYKPVGIISEVFALGVQLAHSANYKLCHRLDTNTDGLVIFSKNTKAYQLVKDAFKKGYITKNYQALLCGNLNKSVKLVAYLAKDAERGVVQIYDSPKQGAVKILTEATPIKTLSSLVPLTLAEITLHTGKTHQIRAHLAHYGYPILGDAKYGDFAANRTFKLKKQCLTACKLGFSFPSSSPLFYLNEVTIQIEPSFSIENII
ncbi:MAG: RluA family pseudouridine synthase [Clostridia bacterium]